jgi:hypothetical protein
MSTTTICEVVLRTNLQPSNLMPGPSKDSVKGQVWRDQFDSELKPAMREWQVLTCVMTPILGF